VKIKNCWASNREDYRYNAPYQTCDNYGSCWMNDRYIGVRRSYPCSTRIMPDNEMGESVWITGTLSGVAKDNIVEFRGSFESV